MNCPNCRLAVPEAALDVHEVAVFIAPAAMRDTGLMAWARLNAGVIRIDGLAVRHAESGELIVTWPERKAENGTMHPIVSVSDVDLRRRVEAAVLAAFLDAARRAGRDSR